MLPPMVGSPTCWQRARSHVTTNALYFTRTVGHQVLSPIQRRRHVHLKARGWLSCRSRPHVRYRCPSKPEPGAVLTLSSGARMLPTSLWDEAACCPITFAGAGLETGREITRRLAAGLGVRPDEVARLRAVMVSSFLLGMALVLYYSASNAIFLTRYGIAKLPYVYIVNGFLVIAFGVGLAFLGRHVAFRAQTLVVNFFLAASILLLWAGIRATVSHAVIFAAAAWFRLLFIYTTLGLWELAARLFDVRQGKRLFALVGLGVMLAAVVGGGLTPVIVGAVGTVNLLLLAASFMGLYALSLSGILRSVNETGRDAKRNRREGLRLLVQDRYTRAIFGLKTFSVLTAYLIEYVFYQQASRRYPDQQSLAGFLGTFTGLTTLVMVLISALLTGRLIASRGVRGTLFVMPMVMTATAVATTAYGALISVGTTFFVLVVVTMFANQVLDKAVEHPGARPAVPAHAAPAPLARAGGRRRLAGLGGPDPTARCSCSCPGFTHPTWCPSWPCWPQCR